MRLVLLTSWSRGLASLCLPQLVAEPGVEVAAAVLVEGAPASRAHRLRRQLAKVRRIGLLGALNGLRLRAWYSDVSDRLRLEPLETVSARCGVPFERTPSVHAPRTRELFTAASADLGLCLGSGYIPESVFSIPRFGVLNVHHEVLPDFRGAPSVLWQIHEGSRETGYTVHEIDRNIDSGRILYYEKLPIEFRSTLRETVTHNYARLLAASVAGVVETVRRYPELAAAARPQSSGRTFTTPTYTQFRRMVWQHRRLAS